MGGRKDSREGSIPLGSGKGQRKADIRKLCEDIGMALGDQHCFPYLLAEGIFEIRKYSPLCLSLQQRNTQSWSEFRKTSPFCFQTDATGGSLNLCIFVVETETREGQQCAHGLETSSLLIHGRDREGQQCAPGLETSSFLIHRKDSFGDHFRLLAM